MTLTGLAVLLAPMAALAAEDGASTLPDTLVTASRLGDGVTGASTTVVTAEEIARSPGQTLQDILERVPGIQTQAMFGGVNGARTSIDMRGFGAAATANTLVLINGRRLNDADLAGIDFASIPRESIERIEVTRGNGGAVLYGDGAVGGVVNIVTKNGFNQPASFGVEQALGSFGYKETNIEASQTVGRTALSLYGGTLTSSGYRDNNKLRQNSAVGEIRQAIDEGELYLNVTADNQHLGLPGGLSRSVAELTPKATTSPRDYGDKQGLNATLGGTRMLADGVELVIDAGIRHKEQQSAFFPTGFDSYDDRSLTALSLTPRAIVEHRLFGLPGKATAGVDLNMTYFEDEQSVGKDQAPVHSYALRQRTLAGYLQDTVSLHPGTDLSLGLRLQNNGLTAKDDYDASAPNNGNFTTVQGQRLDDNDTQYAFHLGLDQRLTEGTTLFGRVGHSFRLPTVDERVGSAIWPAATNFALKTQTSNDAELGLRGQWGPVGLQSSVYLMELRNELHYSPATFSNVNLDPTKRYGSESSLTWQVNEVLRLKGGVAYTRSEFTEGSWKGNEVPLVSRWTGNGGVSWAIWDKIAVLDTDVRYVGPRRFDNDQSNERVKIPSHALVDLHLGGEAGWAHYSVAVQNLFDHKYFDYGIASAFNLTTFNVYELPGRTVIGRFGVRF